MEEKKHIINLPQESDFMESNTPTRARPIEMNQELLELCKKEIQNLVEKKLIRKTKLPWSCSIFYVQKQTEIERGVLRLVNSCKPLNKVFWIDKYSVPKKEERKKRYTKSLL